MFEGGIRLGECKELERVLRWLKRSGMVLTLIWRALNRMYSQTLQSLPAEKGLGHFLIT